MNTREEFGAYLKELREKLGMTQLELAKAAGYRGAQYISNLERGVCAFPQKKLRVFAKVFKVNPGSMFAKWQSVKIAGYERQIGLRR